MGDFGEFLEELEMVDDVMREHRSFKVYLLRADPFTTYSNRQFKRRYRFSKTGVERVFERIGEGFLSNMAGNSGLPVSPMLQLMICMNLFASGSYQESVGEVHGVSHATISRIVGKVSRALAGLRREIIQFPSSMQELRDEKTAFFGIARMPKIIGCIDCTHIKICNPGGADAQGYINRKNFFSINVQVVAGADLKIKNIVARWRGSTHDSRIFNESKLKEKFEQGLYGGILLGDSGYACQPYLLTPVRNPQTSAEAAYNSAHIKTRNVVERLFGVWKMTFRALYRGLTANLETCKAMIVAMAVLHNLRREYRSEESSDSDSESDYEEEDVDDHVEAQGERGNVHRRRYIAMHF